MTRSPEASLSACGGAAVGSVDDIDMNADFSDTDSAFSVDSRVESEKMKRVISKLKCDLESERGKSPLTNYKFVSACVLMPLF